MEVKELAEVLLNKEEPLFVYLMERADQLAKSYTKGAWLEKNALENAISCQDVWSDWIFDFLKRYKIVVKDFDHKVSDEENAPWDFVVEVIGQVILWPVFEFYINGKGKENLFSEEIVKIWNFGDLPDLSDFRKAFHKEYTSLINRWKKGR
jgi:hypothetical protein